MLRARKKATDIGTDSTVSGSTVSGNNNNGSSNVAYKNLQSKSYVRSLT